MERVINLRISNMSNFFRIRSYLMSKYIVYSAHLKHGIASFRVKY